MSREPTRFEEAQMTRAEVKREFIEPQRRALAVARAEKAVVRAAVALRKARYKPRSTCQQQWPLAKNTTTLLWNLDFRVEQLWEAQAKAKKGRSKK